MRKLRFQIYGRVRDGHTFLERPDGTWEHHSTVCFGVDVLRVDV
jgi:hypothetical protein